MIRAMMLENIGTTTKDSKRMPVSTTHEAESVKVTIAVEAVMIRAIDS
jgi:hypothetical protein